MPITIREDDIEYLCYYGNFYLKKIPTESTYDVQLRETEILSKFLTIIDARDAEEFEESHIRGSINIPKTELLANPETAIAQAKNNILIIRCTKLNYKKKDAITQILKKHNPNITVAFILPITPKKSTLPFMCKNENHSTVSTDITQNFININKITKLIHSKEMVLTEENQKFAIQKLQTLLQKETKKNKSTTQLNSTINCYIEHRRYNKFNLYF